MYEYIIGQVKDMKSNAIILENNKIAYFIYTPNPYVFKIDEEVKVYLYHHLREDEESLYGFKNKEDKEMFLNLIEVKGVGPKTALPILATGSISGIVDAIERENVLYLKKFPKIGEKVAKQIILDLKGKLKMEVDLEHDSSSEDLYEVLKGLGYKDKEIKQVVIKVDNTLTIEEQVKEALKLLLK